MDQGVRRWGRGAWGAAGLVLTLACGQPPPGGRDVAQMPHSLPDALRASAGAAPPAALPSDAETAAEQACLAVGTVHLALSLLQVLDGGPSHNILFSPYSLTRALGLLQMGARGRTAEQLAHALHVPNTGPRLAPAYGAAQAALSAEAQRSRAHTQLVQADAVWGAPWVSPETPFLSAVAAGFTDAWHTVDFAETSSLARDTINRWVCEQTGGHIHDLFAQDAPSVHTHLLLINTLFVSAPWAKAFNPKFVKDAPFYNADASVAFVPTMVQQIKGQLAQACGYIALDVPYRAAGLSLTLVMPQPGQNAVIEELTADCLEALWAHMQPEVVDLSLPKFKVEASFGVKDALMAVGVQDVFMPEQADLGGIDGHATSLYVDEVVHRATLEVNEKGTLASAATGILLRTTAVAEHTEHIHVDRPFLFFMRDRQAGTLLFAGKVSTLGSPPLSP
ncbi:hypothetical protein Q3G72_004220 [Acer saccharum]|nr:hypothetical protein Q3G72_004220 [Acer saccharum]